LPVLPIGYLLIGLFFTTKFFLIGSVRSSGKRAGCVPFKFMHEEYEENATFFFAVIIYRINGAGKIAR
jgi:hypothetical protein